MNKLSIKNFGIINFADIEINQINVIGGVNSTGKSTSSKLFYCFLRSNSSSKQDLALDSLIKRLRHFNNNLNRYVDACLSYLNSISCSEENECKYEIYCQIKEELKDTNIRPHRIFYNIDFDDIYNIFNNLKPIYEKICDYPIEFDEDFIKSKLKENHRLSRYGFFLKNFDLESFSYDFMELDKLINIVFEDNDDFSNFAIKKLFNNEFKTNFLNNFSVIKFNYDLSEFEIHIENNLNIESRGLFEINNVYYLDSFSIFDIDRNMSNIEHVKTLFKDLMDKNDSDDFFDDIVNDKIIELEKKVSQIINGKIVYNRGKFQFSLPNGDFVDMMNTASGIKQIAIIQMLLANRKLNEDSFLIIDEPEVNLHPKWQVKFAEILVLLSKKLNITLYINSHSPMFIEAIDTFSQIYDLEDKTNYYLTCESEIPNKFDINKIDSNELYVLYDNLGEPYDYLDKLKLKNNIN